MVAARAVASRRRVIAAENVRRVISIAVLERRIPTRIDREIVAKMEYVCFHHARRYRTLGIPERIKRVLYDGMLPIPKRREPPLLDRNVATAVPLPLTGFFPKSGSQSSRTVPATSPTGIRPSTGASFGDPWVSRRLEGHKSRRVCGRPAGRGCPSVDAGRRGGGIRRRTPRLHQASVARAGRRQRHPAGDGWVRRR
ncbi:MAG: hypothetical protein ACI91T_001731 [Natronomonas sp.]|jgi:hypothetical protein